jgi:hypothetical protein
MREKRNSYKILMEKPEGKRPQGDHDVGRWIILKCLLERQDGVV